MRLFLSLGILLASIVAVPTASADRAGKDFIAEARALLVVGACADGELPAEIAAQGGTTKGGTARIEKLVAAHCKKVRAAQDDYKKRWLGVARTFFAANVPGAIPKKVVYPFAGGDLATALAVFPDADEITTLSLEPAGDPRALARVGSKQLAASLATVAAELRFLYHASFSVTMNMIPAMRAGKLPTQLIFSLSALWIHGYEPVSLRYFQLAEDGAIRYLGDADLVAIDELADVAKRNRALSNVELRFKRPGSTRVQTYRHIMANLDDKHLAAEPAALAHLEAKGTVAAMTKAASYLLSFGEFSTMRQYLVDHVAWMVSDSTGLPPKYGQPAGFEYETWGQYESSNMKAGGSVTPAWRAMFAAQPKRKLPFRFGYPDGKHRGHLIIMRKK